MAWKELLTRLQTGDPIELETESPLYRGPYVSSVVSVFEEALRIAMPLDAGRLVLIPVGTRLQLRSTDGEAVVDGIVTDRRGGRERYLEVRPAAEVAAAETAEAVAVESDVMGGRVPIIAVTSGKGGVGKSTLAVNIAIALESLGKRACIIDGDLGTANVDVLLKLAPPFNLGDVVSGKKHMVEVLVEGPKGVLVLPGGSGLVELTRLSDELFSELTDQFRALEQYADVILLDTGSGVASNVTRFVAAASQAIVVTTPEPHAVTDAYSMLRILAEEGLALPTHLVVNRAQSDREAMQTTERMVYAARRFLHYELMPLGVVREDPAVRQAVRRQIDLVTEFPRARATRDIHEIAGRISDAIGGEASAAEVSGGGTGAFLRRFRSLWTGRAVDAACADAEE